MLTACTLLYHVSYYFSIYYVTESSQCSKIAPLIKNDVKHSLYMRLRIENAGEIVLFLKDGHSDTIYYHTYTINTVGMCSDRSSLQGWEKLQLRGWLLFHSSAFLLHS